MDQVTSSNIVEKADSGDVTDNGQLPAKQNNAALNCTKNHHKNRETQIDREERLRVIKEKQNEERQRKLEELKLQALAAQKFREKSEEERRRRIEELRSKDLDRRQHVEERKKIIVEAERERREAILRRNQEREARIENRRKSDRSSVVFAFGSSTPRMLEATESGTYWASRRATSTTNVMTMSVAGVGPLTRRSSERELAAKKRATSAGGLFDRNDQRRPMDSIYEILYWDHAFNNKIPLSVYNPGHTLPYAATGGGKQQQQQQQQYTNGNGVATRRKKTDLMPIAPSLREMMPLPQHGRAPSRQSPPGSKSGEATPATRPQSAQSQNVAVVAPVIKTRPNTAPFRKPRPISIAVTGISADAKQACHSTSAEMRPPMPKASVTKKQPQKSDKGTKTLKAATPKETPLQSPTVPLSMDGSCSGSEASISWKGEGTGVNQAEDSSTAEESAEFNVFNMSGSMTSSQIKRITTEEEAKAALAERRKLEADKRKREAELEQQRLEAERLAEEERQRKEEEEHRKMEEEQLRLLEELRLAEEQRLQQAIEEAKKREEEERAKKEEEQKLKLEKEEADRKAKEEAERQRREMEIRLKKEEEDRQARRKRVEDIMSRTRAKGSTTPSFTRTKDDDLTEDFGNNLGSNGGLAQVGLTTSASEMMTHSESLEDSKSKQNGLINGDFRSRNNKSNTLLDLSEFETLGNVIDLGKDNFSPNKQDLTDLVS